MTRVVTPALLYFTVMDESEERAYRRVRIIMIVVWSVTLSLFVM